MRNFKWIYAYILATLCTTNLYALTLSSSMQKACDAYIELRDAIGQGNEVALRAAFEDMIDSGVGEYNFLKQIEGEDVSLNGHVVFTKAFIDDMLKKRDVYRFAKRYVESNRSAHGVTERILCQTGIVAANKSVKYTLTTKGNIELVVIPEYQGLVTLRIHDTTHNDWYNDIIDEETGRPERVKQISLPMNTNTSLEIEVINTTDKVISFACLYGY